MSARSLVSELAAEIGDRRVLDAIREVPRDAFVPAPERRRAWANMALPIGEGQTISQPLVVARMCELLELQGHERVLDVGTGSGYHAAVLGRLAARVWSIEVHRSLTESARMSLRRAGARNVELRIGDGSAGLPELAPFDAINVAAAGPVARLATLLEQLAPGGRLVAPVIAPDADQRLVLLRRLGDGGVRRSDHERVRFVPLVVS